MRQYPRMPWGRNHKSEQPSRLVFLDTETMSIPSQEINGCEVQILRLGCASLWTKGKHGFAKRDHIRFQCVANFWQWLYGCLNKRRPTWVYAHNMAFDATVLGLWREIDTGNIRIFDRLDNSGCRTDSNNGANRTWRGKLAIDGVPFIVEGRTDNGPIRFVDTLNYWNCPLRKLGRYVGLPKLDFDPFSSDEEYCYTYCENDVAIIEKAVISLMDYWRENNLGNWQPTVASLAYSSFRHGQERCTICPHGDYTDEEEEKVYGKIVAGANTMSAGDVSECERRCYYGGKTECFFIGDITSGSNPQWRGTPDLYYGGRSQIAGPVTVFDVNSMYPFIMRSFQHPFELMDAIRHPQLSVAQRLIEEFWCCADVEVNTNEACYPKRTGQFTLYPVGRFATSLCGSELATGLATGSITGIANLCVYYSGSPFARFISDWSERRIAAINNGEEIKQRFCNLIMQSLYGKLAQLTPPWQTDGIQPPPVRWGTYFGTHKEDGKPCIMRAIGGISQYQTTRRNCRHTFTAAAASVTSAARNYMRHLISLCPPNSIVYMDTDSLFCLPQAAAKLTALGLVHPTELGKLKEKGTYNRVRIWGPKDYEIDGERVIAGLSSDNVEIAERVWNTVTFEGVKQVIQRDPDYKVIMKTIRFAPALTLHSRKLRYDGWTEPLECS